jgi:hypothetical protein
MIYEFTLKVKFILLIFLFAYLTAQETHLKLFEKDGLYGYKNQHDQIVISAKYPAAMNFNEKGIAAVADSSGWAYIDTQGNILIRPYIYDNGPDYISEGLARFVENSKFGFFDDSGKIVIDAQWDFAYPFKNGRTAVCKGCKIIIENEHCSIIGGEWGYIDRTGKVIIPIGSVNPDSVHYKLDKIDIFRM